MYKVLIVDDEVLARVGIKSFVQWEEAGFEIVGEAENGKKAFAMIKDLKPDVVITDIHMPVMNGIDLIKTVKEEKIPVNFIVLSSYNDFEYVKEAMKLGADDYILKLEMEPESLNELLNTLKEKIEAEHTRKSEEDIHVKHTKENISTIKEKLFKDMVFGNKYRNEEFKERLKAIQMELPQKNLFCIVLHLDNKGRFNKRDVKDGYLLDFAILNIINEILSDFRYGNVFCSQPEEYVIIFSEGKEENRDRMNEKLAQMERLIKRYLKEYLNINVSIGISDVFQEYVKLQVAYQQALYAVNQNFNFQIGSAIRYTEIVPRSVATDLSIKIDFKDLERQLEAADVEGIQNCFDIIINSFLGAAASLTREYLRATCAALVLIINSYLDESGVEKGELWQADPYKQLEELKTQKDFISWIEKLKNTLLEVFKQTDESKRMIVKAKQFIIKYYMEDISLDSVAEHISISPNYLSTVFKKETGHNFIDYLTNARIEAAKKLLKEQKYKIYEISKMVGYENEHYFSRVFKKITGMSPIKFKL
ncbi:response regulator [Paenibacillus sp. HWE-109]|uniref:response regulator n=1 Tax=Paenibacillus sp. HWE-109 TaxID=1306526 RepID=UPI001EDFB931|nr:response regulator [Paenibacillus sp. HWE-109]UKS28167.1 response regulator [Paenibacillus sp. HWE-109]